MVYDLDLYDFKNIFHQNVTFWLINQSEQSYETTNGWPEQLKNWLLQWFYKYAKVSDLEIWLDFKGSSHPNHFIFEIHVGKSRIRHRTTLKLNDNRLRVDLEIIHFIQIHFI